MFNKKILCLGNNSEDTDKQVYFMSRKNKTKNHGLMNKIDSNLTDYGFYHVSLVDLSAGQIIKIANQFDQIILLDQPESTWSSNILLFSTFNLMVELEKNGLDTNFRNNSNIARYSYFDNLFQQNKSFCIYPWIELTEQNEKITLCARSEVEVTTRQKLHDWRNDSNFNEIRQKMLLGEKLDEHCEVCYYYEDNNIESYRQFDSKYWISRLGIDSLQDLEKITHPYFYEVRLSNKCNLMCRSCNPSYSHLIEQEVKTHKLTFFDDSEKFYKYTAIDIIDIESLNSKSMVYLTGGEPTIINDVFKFMQDCINRKRTDFHLTFSTNGMKFSQKFIDLTRHFNNVNFSFSMDGYDKVNDYWRWNSKWNTLVSNAKLMQSLGHQVNINCVPGIYNVTNLHLLYEFLDKEFPFTTVYLQLNYEKNQSAMNHPDAELVVKSMERCMQTGTYYSDGKSNKTTIDRLHSHYSKNPECNLSDLKNFFEYMDTLDKIRDVRMKDYIPELDDCRKFLT
jgi:molybdenum cofactor biosynthesis enzyme MoaA